MVGVSAFWSRCLEYDSVRGGFASKVVVALKVGFLPQKSFRSVIRFADHDLPAAILMEHTASLYGSRLMTHGGARDRQQSLRQSQLHQEGDKWLAMPLCQNRERVVTRSKRKLECMIESLLLGSDTTRGLPASQIYISTTPRS